MPPSLRTTALPAYYIIRGINALILLVAFAISLALFAVPVIESYYVRTYNSRGIKPSYPFAFITVALIENCWELWYAIKADKKILGTQLRLGLMITADLLLSTGLWVAVMVWILHFWGSLEQTPATLSWTLLGLGVTAGVIHLVTMSFLCREEDVRRRADRIAARKEGLKEVVREVLREEREITSTQSAQTDLPAYSKKNTTEV